MTETIPFEKGVMQPSKISVDKLTNACAAGHGISVDQRGEVTKALYTLCELVLKGE